MLALLPFWTPLIPPMGIAVLKRFLQSHGCIVKTFDTNIQLEFKEIYNTYFRFLECHVPPEKRGNFYNIGHDLQQNHLMAHMHKSSQANQDRYFRLLHELVYKIFYISFSPPQLQEMDQIATEFYRRLEVYLIDHLMEEKPDVLGLTVHIHTLPASLFAFKITREKFPHIQTVMGGGIFTEQLAVNSPNLDYFQKNTPYIDKIIIGEGELPMLKFLLGEIPPAQKIITLQDIGAANLDISQKERPDFSDFNIDYYSYLPAAGSVSCPFQCSFCSETIYFGKYSKKNPSQTYAELLTFYQKYRRQLVIMTDSLLNPIIHDLSNQFIHSPYAMYWDGCLRVSNEVGEVENTLKWRRGGFYRASLGIETGSQRVLNLMGKGITVEQSKAALRALAYAGIKTTTYWLIGYPGESEEDFIQTLAFLEELKDDIYEAESHPFQFLPGLVKYEQWTQTNPVQSLYSADARGMLLITTFIMVCDPPREEIYRRLNRFVNCCNRLGIPNPYSEKEIFWADERWKKLHKNAVPSLVEFKENNKYLDECKQVEIFTPLKKLAFDEAVDFDF